MEYGHEKNHAHGEPSGNNTHRSLTSEPSTISSTSSPPSFPLPPPLARHREHNGQNANDGAGNDGRASPERLSRLKVAFARPPSFPAVIWNDKQSISASSTASPNPARPSAAATGQTFYSEGTPPPSPTDFRSNISSSGAPEYGAGYGFHSKPTPKLSRPYDYSYDHVAPPAPIPSGGGRWFSPRKKIFWVVLALLLVLIAVAVGVGVGVGLSQGGSSKEGTSDSASEPSTTSHEPSTTQTETDSPSSTSTSPATTTTSSSSTGACPSANNTVYEVPNSDKTFLRLCGVDYPGETSAEDLATVWTASMVDCITNCAGFPNCTACSWGALEGDRGDNHRCYLKRDLGKAQTARAGWDFAILED